MNLNTVHHVAIIGSDYEKSKHFYIDQLGFQLIRENYREVSMSDFSVRDMLEMQQTLQKKYKDKWEPICPETGKNKLLWMVGEIGEVIDIVKKNGDIKAIEDPLLREHLVEELADVLMYYNDVLLCYGISDEELKSSYVSKFEKNMKRW